MQEYQEVITEITRILNNNSRNGNIKIADNFKTALRDLAINNGIELSTKFLRNLISNDKTNRQKTIKIRDLLKRTKLKKQKRNRYFPVWVNKCRVVDVIEYAHKKNGVIYPEPCKLSEQEEQQLKEIEEVKTAYGIELYPYPLMALKERQARRNAINSNGNGKTEGVYIKDIRSQNTSNFFKAHDKQTYFFITGF